MEIIGLLLGLVFIGILLYGAAALLVGFFCVGAFITLPALGVITVVVFAWRGWRYKQARSWHKRQLSRDDSLMLAAAFVVLWIVAFFANWRGTEAFFGAIGRFCIRGYQ